MSILDPEISDHNQEIQKAVVAFAENGVGLILHYFGTSIGSEIEHVGYCPDELGILDRDTPDHGIWVWEGTFRYWRDYEGEFDIDIQTKNWREPNFLEWQAIINGKNPFMNDVKPNLNNDYFQPKDDLRSALITLDKLSTLSEQNKYDAIRSVLTSQKTVNKKICPKCNTIIIEKQCSGCGYFLG